MSQPLRPATHEKNLRRNPGSRCAYIELQAALGERMHAAGIDDGEHGARINAADEQLCRAKDDGIGVQALTAARHQLVLQLAAAALEDDGPLPGAETEYRAVLKAQASMDRHEKAEDARLTARLE